MDSSSQQSLHDGGMPTSREIVEFEISKEEFADCLGMKPNSQFVAQMFALSDKHNRGFLRYREILELVIVMSKGRHQSTQPDLLVPITLFGSYRCGGRRQDSSVVDTGLATGRTWVRILVMVHSLAYEY